MKNIGELLSTGQFVFKTWCSGCNAEEAVITVDVMMEGVWVPVELGQQCLTRLQEADRIESQ